MWLTLYYDKQAHILDILKVDELLFPILLGHNAPGFGSLVWTAIRDMAFAEDKDGPLGSVRQTTAEHSQSI